MRRNALMSKWLKSLSKLLQTRDTEPLCREGQLHRGLFQYFQDAGWTPPDTREIDAMVAKWQARGWVSLQVQPDGQRLVVALAALKALTR